RARVRSARRPLRVAARTRPLPSRQPFFVRPVVRTPRVLRWVAPPRVFDAALVGAGFPARGAPVRAAGRSLGAALPVRAFVVPLAVRFAVLRPFAAPSIARFVVTRAPVAPPVVRFVALPARDPGFLGAVTPWAARFFGTCGSSPRGPSSIGRGRYSTSSLPIDCTAVQPSAEQISVDIACRWARSSP